MFKLRKFCFFVCLHRGIKENVILIACMSGACEKSTIKLTND